MQKNQFHIKRRSLLFVFLLVFMIWSIINVEVTSPEKDRVSSSLTSEPTPSYIKYTGSLLIQTESDITDFKNEIGDTANQYVIGGAGTYTIQNILFDANGADYGIFVSGYSDGALTFKNITVINVKVPVHNGDPIDAGDRIYYNFTQSGIYISQTTQIMTIDGCHIYDAYVGVRVYQPTLTVTIKYTQIQNSTAAGIYADSANNLQIRDNYIWDCYSKAIYVEDSDDIQITGNNLYQNAVDNVYLDNCDNGMIKQNTIWGSQGMGIYLIGGNNNEVSYNDVSLCGVGIYADSGGWTEAHYIDSKYINVSENWASRNEKGIVIKMYIEAEIKSNNASYNDEEGIVLDNNLGAASPPRYVFNQTPSSDADGDYFQLHNNLDFTWQEPVVYFRRENYAPVRLNTSIGENPPSLSSGETFLETDQDQLYINSGDIAPGYGAYNPSTDWIIVYPYFVPSADIIDNIAYNNGKSGIAVIKSNNTVVSASQVRYNGEAGIKVADGGSNTVNNSALISDNNYGIYVDEVGDTIKDNTILYSTSAGIYLGSQTSNTAITSCSIRDSEGDGIEIYGNDNDILGCVIDNNDKDGIVIYGDDNVVQNNNHIKNNHENGVKILGDDNYIQNSNVINTNTKNGIAIEGGSHNYISGNEIGNNDENGIYISESFQTQVQDNLKIDYNGKAGIYIAAGCSNLTIKGNFMKGSGFFVEPDARNNLISHNIDPENYINGQNVRYWKETNGTVMIDFNSDTPGEYPSGWSCIDHESSNQTLRVRNAKGPFPTQFLEIHDNAAGSYVEATYTLVNKYYDGYIEFDSTLINDTINTGNPFILSLRDSDENDILKIYFEIIGISGTSNSTWRIGLQGNGATTYYSDLELNEVSHVRVTFQGGTASLDLTSIGSGAEINNVDYNQAWIAQIYLQSSLTSCEGSLYIDNIKLQQTDTSIGQVILAYCPGFVVNGGTFSDTNAAVELLYSNSVEVSGVSIDNVSMYGVYLYSSSDVEISNSNITDANIGIYTENSDETSITSVDIDNSGNTGIKILNGYGSTVSQCRISDSRIAGIWAEGDQMIFSGSGLSVENSGQYGIYLTGFNNSITDGTISGSGHNSIYIKDQQYGTIEGLTITDSASITGQSILIENGSLIRISQNTIHNPVYPELEILRSRNLNILSNNFEITGIFINGTSRLDYNTHTVSSNQLGIGSNKKPIVFYIGRSEEALSPYCNQIILVDCNETQIYNLNLANAYVPIQLYYSSYNIILGNAQTYGNITDGIYANILMKYSDHTQIQYFNIEQDDNSAHNILATDSDYLTVESCIISNGIDAINLINGYSPSISDTTITGGNRGLYLENIEYAEINSITIKSVSSNAIYIKGGHINFLEDLTFQSCGGTVVYMESASNFYIQRVDVKQTSTQFIEMVDADYNMIQDINIENPGATTMVTMDKDSSNNVLDRLNVAYSAPTSTGYIVKIYGDNNQIIQIYVVNATGAIYIDGGDNSIIQYNSIYRCSQSAIYIENADGATIEFNYLKVSNYGIRIDLSKNIEISLNQIRNSTNAIYIETSSHIQIRHNYFCDNENRIIKINSADISEVDSIICTAGESTGTENLVDESDKYNIEEATAVNVNLSQRMIIAMALIAVGAFFGAIAQFKGPNNIFIKIKNAIVWLFKTLYKIIKFLNRVAKRVLRIQMYGTM